MTERTVSETDVRESVEMLGRYTNRTVTPEACQSYVTAFAGKVSHVGFAEGMRRWIETHGPTSFVPSIQDVRLAIQDARSGRWLSTKRDTPTWQTLGECTPDPYVRAACRLMVTVMEATSWSVRAQIYRDFARESGVVEPWTRLGTECAIAARGTTA